MIPNWNLISINIQLAKQITKILFTNVDIHSTNHLYLINFTYLATLRTHLEERIAHHEDRLKSKKKKTNDEDEENFPRQRKYIFSNDFERDVSKGTVAHMVRREVGWDVERRRREEGRASKNEERKER